MSPRAKPIVLLAGSVSVLWLSYLLVATAPEHPVEGALAQEDDPPASAAPVALAPLEVEESAPSPTRQAVSEPQSIPIEGLGVVRFEARRSMTRSIAGGRLRVRAIDSATGEPLHHVRVRAMSSTRLADRESDQGTGEIELTLTPDTYSLLVQSKGYEPRELDPVRIVAGETVSPDATALSPGGARILGVVHGMDSNRALHVELIGEGRRPCARCAAVPEEDESLPLGPLGAWARRNPCIGCGYSESATRLTLPSSGAFAFDRLAGGTYALRLTLDGHRTLGLPTLVELRAEESVSVAMEALGTRNLRLELFDTDGSTLATEWSKRVRQSEPMEDVANRFLEVVVQSVPPVDFACGFREGDVWLARAEFCSPFVGTRSWSFATSCGGIGLGGQQNDDRPRGDSETLRAAPPIPEVELMYVDSMVDAEGLVFFEHVPSMALVLEIESGPFKASVSVPAAHDTTRVSARLTRTGSSESFLEYEAIHDRAGRR